jgi:hypothetical protein
MANLQAMTYRYLDPSKEFNEQSCTMMIMVKEDVDKIYEHVPNPLSQKAWKKYVNATLKVTRGKLITAWNKGGKKLKVLYQAYWDNLMQYWMSNEGKNRSELSCKTRSCAQKVS